MANVEAHITGTVWKVECKVGDTIAEGDTVAILESMKMELAITAPHAGTVAGLALSPGDRVALKQPLVAVLAEGASGADDPGSGREFPHPGAPA